MVHWYNRAGRRRVLRLQAVYGQAAERCKGVETEQLRVWLKYGAVAHSRELGITVNGAESRELA